MYEKKEGAIYDAKTLGIPKMLILGLQHMFAMFGATILVPILISGYLTEAVGAAPSRGLTVSVTLFCAGFGTLVFHLCSKLQVPAFLGSSFAFLGGFFTIANLDTGIYANMSANDRAAYMCGGIVVAGLLYFILALIIKLAGVNRVMKFLPPVVTGPIIICIGLSLAPSAVSNASNNWLLAIIALGVIIIFNIWGKGLFKIIPILMGVIISYVCAVIFNACGMLNADGSAILNFKAVADAGIVGLPQFQLCKFDFTAILVMAPIAIAAMMEHIFGELYRVPEKIRIPYFKVKVLELLLYLDAVTIPADETVPPYFYKTQVEKVKAIHDFLTGHIAENFTQDELSRRFDIPMTQMKNCFRSVYGSAIGAWLTDYRMNMAAELLINRRELGIAEIGGKVGYDNAGKFTEAFKRIMKLTPTEYRKERGISYEK